MSRSSFFEWFRANEQRSRRNVPLQTRRRRFEQLKDCRVLSATPLDPIEIPMADDPPVIGSPDLSEFLAPVSGEYAYSLVDEGDFYWYFDERRNPGTAILAATRTTISRTFPDSCCKVPPGLI